MHCYSNTIQKIDVLHAVYWRVHCDAGFFSDIAGIADSGMPSMGVDFVPEPT
jgi:hypothetical protein